MAIDSNLLNTWRNEARDALLTGDPCLAQGLAREAVPKLIDEVVRLSAGSERDRIAVLMAQALVTGQVADGGLVTLTGPGVAEKAYAFADALLDERARKR